MNETELERESVQFSSVQNGIQVFGDANKMPTSLIYTSFFVIFIFYFIVFHYEAVPEFVID